MTTYSLRNSDIYVENGNLALENSIGQIAQDVYTQLRTFLGDYFINVNYGLDLTPILNNPVDTGLFDVLVKQSILSVRGMQSITTYQSLADSRERSYTINFTGVALNDQLIVFNETFAL